MHLPELDQEMAVLGEAEAQELNLRQPRRWSIISICDSQQDPPAFPKARRLLRLTFDDVEKDFIDDATVPATEQDIKQALEFARTVGREPLLIHCAAGISRSTALAWIIVYDRVRGRPKAATTALQLVRRVRPKLVPNRHVLRLGIWLVARNAEEAKRLRSELQIVLK